MKDMSNQKKTIIGVLILGIIGVITYLYTHPNGGKPEITPEASISFSPYPATILNETEVNVFVSTQKVDALEPIVPVTLAFAKVEIHFDKELLQLSDDPKPAKELGQIIHVSSKDEANQTGTVDVTIGMQPGGITPPPFFTLATLSFEPKTSEEKETMLTISKESLQLVEMSGKVFKVEADDGPVKLNTSM